MSRKKIIPLAIIFVVLAISLFFAWPRMTQYSAVDEPYWTYDRISQFWTAVAEKKWKSTNINDKPGITTAIIAGPGLLSIDPMPFKTIRQEPKTPEIIQAINKINFSFRLPIYLATLLFLLLFYIFLKKLLGTTIALFSVIFIGLSPIILGISLIINPDSLLWGFLPLAIISYLVYQKEPEDETTLRKLNFNTDTPLKIITAIFRQKKYLIFSGIFLGLSILTKYVANILYIYLLGLLFLEYIYNFHGQKSALDYLKKSLFEYLALIVISMGVFFLLFPACWHTPSMVIDGTFLSPAFKSTWPIFVGFLGLIFADLLILRGFISKIVLNFLAKYKNIFKKIISGVIILGIAFVFTNVYSGMKFLDFEAIVASPKGGEGFDAIRFISEISANLYVLIFSLTPLVFIFFLWSIFANSFKKNETSSKESTVVLYFSLFIILYYLASEVNHVVATTRYQIVAFPLASIVAAIGLAQLLPLIKWKKIKNSTTTYAFYTLTIIFSTFSLFAISPFFFNYASSLLPQQYVLNLKDMGDGSYEAARFLNTLPDAEHLTIWSDKGAVCETFLGTCKVSFNKNDVKGFDFKYFVVSTGRKNRSLKMSSIFNDSVDFKKLYSSDESGVFRINIGGRSDGFVKVVPIGDIAKTTND